jgi:hypothetical protein
VSVQLPKVDVRFDVTVDAPGALSKFDERQKEKSTAFLFPDILELDLAKCSWGPRRLRLVGTFRGLEQANVLGTVTTQMQWTLSTVYGIDKGYRRGLGSIVLAGLRMRIDVRESAATTADTDRGR